MTVASQFDSLPGGWLAARRTLVLVGHLPVMSGLWLSQYADREARESGPVCLVRVAADSVQLELFRTGSRRPSIRPQAKYDEALRAIAPVVSHWLVVPQSSSTEALDIPAGTDDIVVLTGSDQAAVVAAYKLVKAAHEASERAGGARPAISVAVLGADAAETAHVAARIGEAAGAALSTHVPVRGGLQRVAPVESSFRGTFDDPAPSLGRICEIISGASVARPMAAAAAESIGDAAAPDEVRSQSRAHARADVHADHAPLRFAPRSDRRAPSARVAVEPIPFRSEPPARRAPERVPPARVAPAPAAIPLDRQGEARSRAILAEASGMLRDAASVLRDRTPAAPTAPASTVPPSTASAAADPQLQPARGAYHASAVAGPSVAPPLARIVEGGLPESLVVFVDGLTRVDHVAPRCERIEFAVDAAGRLHLVCRIDDLRPLQRARLWLRENVALLRRAYPEVVTADDPAVDVFVQDLHDLSPIDGATIHMIRQLEFAGRRCFDVQTLSA
jgi:hypothetical protein